MKKTNKQNYQINWIRVIAISMIISSFYGIGLIVKRFSTRYQIIVPRENDYRTDHYTLTKTSIIFYDVKDRKVEIPNKLNYIIIDTEPDQ